MKKTIRTIVTVGFIIICACLFGSIQISAAAPTTESIIDVTQVKDFTANDGSLQLYFNDGTGYYWEKDGVLSDDHVQYDDSIVDMDAVIDFTATEYGLQLYFEDGTGYYLER